MPPQSLWLDQDVTAIARTLTNLFIREEGIVRLLIEADLDVGIYFPVHTSAMYFAWHDVCHRTSDAGKLDKLLDRVLDDLGSNNGSRTYLIFLRKKYVKAGRVHTRFDFRIHSNIYIDFGEEF